jgi:hypothetical protein
MPDSTWRSCWRSPAAPALGWSATGKSGEADLADLDDKLASVEAAPATEH